MPGDGGSEGPEGGSCPCKGPKARGRLEGRVARWEPAGQEPGQRGEPSLGSHREFGFYPEGRWSRRGTEESSNQSSLREPSADCGVGSRQERGKGGHGKTSQEVGRAGLVQAEEWRQK